MSLKTTKTQVIIIIILIVLLGLSYVLGNGEEVIPNDDKIKNGGEDVFILDPIRVEHKFNNGIHEYRGEISLPTPCYILETEAVVMESFPEQVVLEFEYKKDFQKESCIQMIDKRPFRILFQASKQATVSAKINNKQVELVKNNEK